MNFTQSDIEQYEKLIKERLSEYRYTHSMNVATAAVHLAKKYGADETKARVAGVLHDVTKEDDKAAQRELIEKAGHKMTDIEILNPSVYHQMSGEAFCKLNLHIDDEDILGAIRYHTTGTAGMTLLQKVIYTADFISAERNYPDVDVMRHLAEENLDEAMLYSLKHTINDLVKRGKIIHPDTLNCYNDILKNFTKKDFI